MLVGAATNVPACLSESSQRIVSPRRRPNQASADPFLRYLCCLLFNARMNSYGSGAVGLPGIGGGWALA